MIQNKDNKKLNYMETFCGLFTLLATADCEKSLLYFLVPLSTIS